ncbi:methyl-accepting chemotaxis protein [Bacillus sp. CECT 9360]|uniref:methyl-accepting chemotaxis protein n=1 Tax=Bacillus sp. CECT 9360 TaxID=2845821 RepID=UPI001E3E0407|nr:methyl-accepting chemotaxis protein [Bacillus sp. CECT 9360]CAH0345363.1 Putative sensory transducer protein YfmS [Bacillus sp. CECT 9360]
MNSTTSHPMLEAFVNIAPLLNELVPEDITIGICDTEKFLLSVPGKTFSLGIKPGTALHPNDAITNAIVQKRTVREYVPAEVFGFPIIASAIPLCDENGNVIGGVGLGASLEQYNTLFGVASKLSEAVEQVSATIQELAASTSILSESMNTISEQSKNVLESVSDIEKVANMVRGISDKTNILGLNASIEAARAGEFGKGFSVVANEIRKLAGDSKKHTEGISDSVSRIDQLINRLNSSISTINSETENQSAVSEELSATMVEISANAKELADIAEKSLKG